ncbi:hypothetical protein B0H11DRAFT_2347977 [Mycena galericulata]|nr:hypothetical protein B0H11DRAFT_2347977 [Mycena galericulata]
MQLLLAAALLAQLAASMRNDTSMVVAAVEDAQGPTYIRFNSDGRAFLIDYLQYGRVPVFKRSLIRARSNKASFRNFKRRDYHLPKSRQTLLFSATQTDSVRDLALLSLKNPVYIGSQEAGSTSSTTAIPQQSSSTTCPARSTKSSPSFGASSVDTSNM